MSTAKQVAAQFPDLPRQTEAATLGMWIFLATEVMFFGPLFLGYLYGREIFYGSYAVASRHTDIVLGTLNTAVLLTSSLFMATAVEAANYGALRLKLTALWITIFLGLTFLTVKGIEYHKEWEEGLFPAAHFALDSGGRYFFLAYFTMTGLHAIHVSIGIILLLIFALARQDRTNAFARPQRLRVVALYWHFVDGIWIFIYPLLYLIGRSGT